MYVYLWVFSLLCCLLSSSSGCSSFEFFIFSFFLFPWGFVRKGRTGQRHVSVLGGSILGRYQITVYLVVLQQLFFLRSIFVAYGH